jgi:hypothetical protein
VTKEQHRYIYVQSAIGAAVVNLLLNGALGWGATLGLTEFPMCKMPGVLVDIAATAFGVAFGTCFGVLLQARMDLKRGKITIPDVTPRMETRLARLPKALWVRALLVGLVALLAFATPVCALLALSGAHALPRPSFILVKSVFAAFEAALITPFLVLAALRDCRTAFPGATASAE